MLNGIGFCIINSDTQCLYKFYVQLEDQTMVDLTERFYIKRFPDLHTLIYKILCIVEREKIAINWVHKFTAYWYNIYFIDVAVNEPHFTQFPWIPNTVEFEQVKFNNYK